MGRTSTRYKIKYQAEQIDRYFGRIIDSASFLVDLTEGRSELVNDTMPLFMVGLNECQKLWKRMQQGL